jgi:hypothetical protein
MYFEQLHHLHDELCVILDQFVQLLPEEDANGNYKYFH